MTKPSLLDGIALNDRLLMQGVFTVRGNTGRLIVTTLDTDQPQTTARELPFEFRGEGSEFFKIWIVNILLTVLTLGIYSAWAKVRTNRYFYSNLYLDGESFRYLAEPLDILKGRIIAVVFFLLYSVGSALNPVVGVVMLVLLFLVTPFLIARSIAFNHRVSAYRNVQFRFHGAYGQACMAFLVWPFLGLLTFGILYPYALMKMHRFMVENSCYGTSSFSFEAQTWDYAKAFLVAIAIALVAGVLGFAAGHVYDVAAVVIGGLGYVLAFGYLSVTINNIYFNATALGSHQLSANLETSRFLQIYATNVILIVLTLGLYLPFAKVRMSTYRAEHTTFTAVGSLDDFAAAEKAQVSALGEEMGEVFDFDVGVI
jgi:uncharacterized membrane protein YjgN (DUF898 family)